MSRFQLWAEAQQTLSAKVAEVSGHVGGLVPVTSYRPCASEAEPQVLAVKDSTGAVCVAVTLTVYRGAVVRTSSAPSARIRTSKPMPGDLPVNATRLVHAVKMSWHEGRKEDVTSCVSEPLFLQPSESTVLGEFRAASVRASAIRVPVKLTAASNAAVGVLLKDSASLPRLPAEASDEAVHIEEEEELPAASTAEDAGEIQTARALFHENSFMRASRDHCNFFQKLKHTCLRDLSSVRLVELKQTR